MVKIESGHQETADQTKLKGIVKSYIVEYGNENNLVDLKYYENSAALNNIRKQIIAHYPKEARYIHYISNIDFKTIIKEVIDEEMTVLEEHLVDLTRPNAGFLEELRDGRAFENADKVKRAYIDQHQMTKCGIKVALFFIKDDSLFDIIDRL